MKYLITGATGQLGRRVATELLRRVDADRVAAVIRDPAKGDALEELGVEVRIGDYSKPDSLAEVFDAGDRVLFISTNVPGAERLAQHRAVIDAARRSDVALLAYTSVLNAPNATFSIGQDHWATEKMIKESGVPAAMLRNGWYNENYTGYLAQTLSSGQVLGAAGAGRIATAAVADYAEAAAIILTSETPPEATYELSGDTAWSLADFAAELSRRTGQQITYQSMNPQQYKAFMMDAQVPEASADALLEADAAIERGELADTPGTLGRLLGRPTTTIGDAIDTQLASIGTPKAEGDA